MNIQSGALGSAVLLFFAALAEAAPLRIVVDPGHGGKDRGAVVGALRESAITLTVSQKLADLLNRDRRFSAKLTRTQDTYLALSERVERTQQLGADLFLSIHVNSSKDKGAHGVEIYFQNQLPPDEESMFLAARENSEDSPAPENAPSVAHLARDLAPEVGLIVDDLLRNQRIYASSQLAKSLKASWHGTKKAASLSVRQAPFYVISNQKVPSALVEIGFLTHPEEGTRLAQDDYLDVIAQSLHDGLVTFQEGMDKVPGPRLE